MWQYNLIMVALGGALMAIGFAIYIYFHERKRHKQQMSIDVQK